MWVALGKASSSAASYSHKRRGRGRQHRHCRWCFLLLRAGEEAITQTYVGFRESTMEEKDSASVPASLRTAEMPKCQSLSSWENAANNSSPTKVEVLSVHRKSPPWCLLVRKRIWTTIYVHAYMKSPPSHPLSFESRTSATRSYFSTTTTCTKSPISLLLFLFAESKSINKTSSRTMKK